MAKFNFTDALKKAGDVANKATEKATSVVQASAEKAQVGAKKIMDTTKKETDKISESVKGVAEQKKLEMAEKKAVKKATAEKAVLEATGEKAIAPQNAIKIFYYMMAIDHEITPNEEEKFDLIGKEMDDDFELHKETIINECKVQMNKIIDTHDYYDVIQDGVELALTEEQKSLNGFVLGKLLIWDLLAVAYSDADYKDEERKLLKYIVRKLNVSKDTFLEMESSMMTINDIEKEIDWIKGTEKSYLVVEKQVKELEKRRNDILLAVKALIML